MLKVQFANEAGLDEGGLASEMFNLFFEGIVSPKIDLFETPSNAGAATADASESGASGLFLPYGGDGNPGKDDGLKPKSEQERDDMLRSVGRAIVKW